MYRTYLNRGLVHAGTGPVGALVFWPNAAGGTGHVALSLGDGRVVTTNGYDTNRKVNSIRPASYFGTPPGGPCRPAVESPGPRPFSGRGLGDPSVV
jgi:hypothetical protein